MLMAVAAVSCQKVVVLDLNTSEPRLVIEGNLTTKAGEPQLVFVSTSGSFYTGEGLSLVGDAEVTIRDEDGLTYPLDMQLPEIYYSLDIEPEENKELFTNLTELSHLEDKFGLVIELSKMNIENWGIKELNQLQ